jgi:acetyl-CoA carboxylase, biotin carboxylase subunit
MHLFERDCSVQRRQPEDHRGVARVRNVPATRRRHGRPIADIMRNMGYDNIGTVEMLMAATANSTSWK